MDNTAEYNKKLYNLEFFKTNIEGEISCDSSWVIHMCLEY